MTELEILRQEHKELMLEFSEYQALRAHPVEALAFLAGVLDRYDDMLKLEKEQGQ